MSLVHRTAGSMTVALLSQDWAIELGRDAEDRKRIEQQPRHAFREEIINGRFDNTGPLTEGSRLGLRAIDGEYRAGFIRGRDLLVSLKDDGPVLDHIVIMKEAVLDFARRKELTPPSWWMGPIAEAATAPIRDDVKPTRAPPTPLTGKRPRIMTYLAELPLWGSGSGTLPPQAIKSCLA